MNVETITDPADPRLRDYTAISDAVLLRELGLFVAEGRLVVERVLENGRYIIDSVLMNAASLHAMRPVLEAAEARGLRHPVYLCHTSMFQAATGFNIHRGCLALVRRPPVVDWQKLAAGARLLVVLEAVTNADNVGSVFRNAAAFGVDAVLLSPTTCDPLYRKAVRTSMGAALSVPFARMDPWPAALSQLASKGFSVVAMSPKPQAVSLTECVDTLARQLVALVFGSEGPGLTDSATGLANLTVRIPIREGVDSLNLAVAVGIALDRFVNAGASTA